MEKDNAKPIKVVVTGPESSGKSTLCEVLADHFQTRYVPEYAREYLNSLDREYTQGDLLKIAKGQMNLEDEFQNQGTNILICDTSLEVIRVWSEWKYTSCDLHILEKSKERIPDLFLLMTPDLPWQPDPQRENPDDRDALFSYYKQVLKDYDTEVVEIYGDESSRIALAINAINKILPHE